MAGRNEVAVAYVSLMPSTLGFTKALEKELKNAADGVSQSAGANAGQGFMSGFGDSIKGLAKVVGGAFAAVKAGGAIADVITSASDLNEAVNLVNRVFGESSAAVNDWAKNAAEKFGLSKSAALQAVGVFGAMAIPIGITGDAAVNLSENLVQVATDLGSLYNTSTKDALTALRSGIIGEQEPLRRYGINITEARLKAQAFQDGLVSGAVDANKLSKAQERVDKATRAVAKAYKDAGPDSVKYADAVRDADQANADLEDVIGGKLPALLTAQQKMLAANAIITHDSALAAGDFARTGDQFEGAVKKLKAHFEDFKAAVGAPFLGAIASAIGVINHGLFPAMFALTSVSEKVAKAFGTVFGLIKAGFSGTETTKGIGAISGAFRDFGVDLRAAYDFLARIGGLLSGAFAQAAGIGDAILGVMAGHMEGIKAAAEILVPSLAALVTTFIALKVASEAAAAVQLLAKAFALLEAFVLANPVTLAISAIVAVGVAAFIAYKKIKPFRDFIDGLITSLTRSAVFVQFRLAIASLGPPALIAQRALGLVKEAVFTVIDALKGLGAQRLAQQVLGGIAAVAKQLVKTIGGVALAIATVDASPIGRGLKVAFTGAGAVIRSAVLLMGTFWEAIKNVALTLLKLDWAKFFGGLVRVLVPIVAAFYRLIGAVFRFSGALIILARSAVANLGSAFISIIKRVLPVLLAGFLRFAQIIGPILVRALDLLGKGLDFLTAHMDDVRKAFAATGAFIAGTLVPAIERFGRRAIDALTPVAVFIVTRIIPAVARFAKAAGPVLLDGFLAFVRFLVNDVVPVVVTVAKAIGQAFLAVVGFITSKVAPAIARFAPKLLDGFLVFIGFIRTKVVPVVLSVAGLIIDGFKIVAGFISGTVAPLIGRIATQILAGFLTFLSFVRSAVLPVLIGIGQTIGSVFGAVVGAIVSKVIPALVTVVAFVVTKLIPAIAGFATRVGTAVIKPLVSFVQFMITTFGPVVAQVALLVRDVLVAAFRIAGTAFQTFVGIVKVIAVVIKNVLVGAFNLVALVVSNVLIPQIKIFALGVGIVLYGAFKAIAFFVTNILIPQIKTIALAFTTFVLPVLKVFVRFFVSAVLPAIISVAKAMAIMWAEGMTLLIRGIRALIPGFTALAQFLIGKMIPALVSFGDFVRNVVIPATLQLWSTFRDKVLPVVLDVAAWFIGTGLAAIRAFADFITSTVIPVLVTLWAYFKENVLPVIQEVGAWIADHLVVGFQTLATFVTDTLIPKMSEVWDFIKTKVIPVFQDVAGAITTFVTDAKAKIENWVTTAQEKVNAFVTLLTGIKERVVGVFDDVFKPLANGFVDVLNFIIDKWNGLSFTLPDLPGLPGGGATVGVPPIEHIPRLANGGVLNSPTIALLGENPRTTPEIASPVGLMRDTFRSELDRFGSPTKTGVHIEHFHSTEPSRSILEEMAWRINSGVL